MRVFKFEMNTLSYLGVLTVSLFFSAAMLSFRALIIFFRQ